MSFAHCAGYAHVDTHIAGFSQLHMHGTGIVDYGALGFMPTLGMTAAKTTQRGYLAPFSHARETMEPGYYRVTLDGSEIVTEATATDHVALYRVTFPRGSDGVLIFDLGHVLPGVRVEPRRSRSTSREEGLRGHVHFMGGYSDRFGGVDAHWVARLSRPLTGAGTFADGALAPTTLTQSGTAVGAYIPVDTSADGAVTVAFGLSLTDLEHARANLTAESPSLDFDAARRDSVALWESLLSRARVTARGERALQTYYSAVYHHAADAHAGVGRRRRLPRGGRRGAARRGLALLQRPLALGHLPHRAPVADDGVPEYQRDFVRSIVAMAGARVLPAVAARYGRDGWDAGSCGALMVADTWLQGLRDFDVDAAWTALRRSAMESPSRREALGEYLSLRYVPIEGRGSSASATLEYAYADGALAAMARGLGHTDDAAMFAARAGNYAMLYDPAQRFIVGRGRDRDLRDREPRRELAGLVRRERLAVPLVRAARPRRAGDLDGRPRRDAPRASTRCSRCRCRRGGRSCPTRTTGMRQRA
ncbi:MAG: glycoside hydrolase family 92 protein [Polyangiales bacterium]